MSKKTFRGRVVLPGKVAGTATVVPAAVQHERLVHGEHVRRENRLCALY